MQPVDKNDRLVEHVNRAMLGCVENQNGRAAQAAAYHLRAGGSRIRARLSLAAGAALGLSQSQSTSIAIGCELLHNASLIHDDLQDGDHVRRDRPAVWVAFDPNTALLAGDLLLSAAYNHLAVLPPKAIQNAHRRVADVIAGQCADLDARAAVQCTVAEYERIARLKSGPLLGLPLELPLLVAGFGRLLDTASQAASLFALSYQIADDIDDAASEPADHQANLVTVLTLSGDTDASETAKRLGRAHLEAALVLARALPAGLEAVLRGVAVAAIAPRLVANQKVPA
jgi:geranylgeranyl diphosphate synthase type II